MSKTSKRHRTTRRTVGTPARWALGAAIALGMAGPAAAQYSITNLGTLGGDSQAFALGPNGAAAGASLLANGTTQRAFLTPAGGAIQSLGTLGGLNSFATGINTLGTTQVVGYSDTGMGATQHAFLFTAGGTGGAAGNPQMRDLGTLSGVPSDNSLAFGINSLGQVVGSGINAAGRNVGFRTSVGQTTLTAANDLGTLGGTQSAANAVNVLGQAVGNSTLAGDAVTHAFRTAPNGAITAAGDLGTLGGTFSTAAAINATGQVVGDSLLRGDAVDHAVVWTQGAGGVQITDIGVLRTGDFSQAAGINDMGVVVGSSNLAVNGVDFHAFLYRNSQLVDLNSLISPASGWVLEFASAINNNGQIAGFGLFQGAERAFLLTPVPEPSSAAVLALGVLGIGALAARKRRRASAV